MRRQTALLSTRYLIHLAGIAAGIVATAILGGATWGWHLLADNGATWEWQGVVLVCVATFSMTVSTWPRRRPTNPRTESRMVAVCWDDQAATEATKPMVGVYTVTADGQQIMHHVGKLDSVVPTDAQIRAEITRAGFVVVGEARRHAGACSCVEYDVTPGQHMVSVGKYLNGDPILYGSPFLR